MMSLATTVEQLRGKLREKQANATTTRFNIRRPGEVNPNVDRSKVGAFNIEKWRTIKSGDSKDFDGRTWYWCPRHKDKDGKYDKLYVTHKPGDHDNVMAKRRKMWNRKPAAPSGDTNSGGTKLVVNQKLKEVLCTQMMLSDDEANNICNQVCGDQVKD